MVIRDYLALVSRDYLALVSRDYLALIVRDYLALASRDYLALVRFFSCMNQVVLLQMSELRERFVADLLRRNKSNVTQEEHKL